MNSRRPEELIEEARKSMRNRTKITNSGCDQFLLVWETLIQKVFCFRTKFSRIVKDGKQQIDDELDIYNYMQRLRLTQATVNALTTFNQRRLLTHQVETSFLIRPFGHEDEAKRKKNKIMQKKGRKNIS